MKIGKRFGIPETFYGWIGLALGILGCIMWATQFIWNWVSFLPGADDADGAFYSVITLLIIIFACAFIYVGNRLNNTRKRLKGRPAIAVAKIAFLSFIGIILIVMVLNGVSMTMDTTYATYANNNLGLLTGLRQLTTVTSADLDALSTFALGVKQIVRSMFLIIPCIIATWGGLSVLTADSIDEAEGGILAIVAAFIVFIIVWIFKFIDIQLMFLAV